jgi:hypothetical protein
VIRIDPELDLAVLQAQQAGPYVSLPLGKSDALFETNEILALGYPFGGALALDTNSYPSVSVNAGHVTSLRKKAGQLQMIQVDAALNPGNSGGPILDSAGAVVGIVRSGILGSGINFAIPVKSLSGLLKEPVVTATPTTLAYDKRTNPQSIVVKTLSFEHPAPGYAIELTIKDGQGAARVYNSVSIEGVCRFTVPLVAASKEVVELPITATFNDGGAITGTAPNRLLAIGANQLKLADARKIEFSAPGKAVVSTGTSTFTGNLALDNLPLTVGGVPLHPNWAAAQNIVITGPGEPLRSIPFVVKVKLKDIQVASVEAAFDLSADGSAPPPGAVAMTTAGSTADMWGFIHRCVADHQTTETQSHGGAFSMRDPYQDIPEAGLLVGFNFSLGAFMNHSMIDGLQPIFLTSKGEVLGQKHGKFSDPVTKISAKPGYVVTGIRVRGGGNFDGFGLTYTRLANSKLVSADTYESEWIGVREGGSEKELPTGGGVVVGITGKQAEKIGSIALVVLQLDKPATASAQSPTPGPAISPPSVFSPIPTSPVAQAPTGEHIPLPEVGQPYTSIAQMFETLPNELQPSGPQWAVGRRVSPDLSHRLKNQPALLTGEFGGAEVRGQFLEVTLDAGYVDYRGFRFVGQIICRFPATSTQFKTARVHDKFTVAGKIDGCVVRGSTIDKVFLWLNEPQTKWRLSKNIFRMRESLWNSSHYSCSTKSSCVWHGAVG